MARSLLLVERAIKLAEAHGLLELEVPGVVRLVRRPTPAARAAVPDDEREETKPRSRAQAMARIADSDEYKAWVRGLPNGSG